MKKCSAIAVFALFIAIGAAAGTVPARFAGTQSTGAIAAIRQRYATINRNQAKYRKIKKDLSGFSTEGGELVVYHDGPAIVKMVARFYGESGRAFEEYYYRDQQLIFVFRKEFRYDNPLSGRVVSSKQQRFYFNNGQLIKWLDENGRSVAPGEEYLTKQQEILDSSKEFTEAARSPGKMIEARP